MRTKGATQLSGPGAEARRVKSVNASRGKAKRLMAWARCRRIVAPQVSERLTDRPFSERAMGSAGGSLPLGSPARAKSNPLGYSLGDASCRRPNNNGHQRVTHWVTLSQEIERRNPPSFRVTLFARVYDVCCYRSHPQNRPAMPSIGKDSPPADGVLPVRTGFAAVAPRPALSRGHCAKTSAIC